MECLIHIVGHEQTPGAQATFLSEVKLLRGATDEPGHLTALHTKDVVASDSAAAAGLRNLYCTGKEQYNYSVSHRFHEQSVSFWHPFSHKTTPISSVKSKLSSSKAIFQALYCLPNKRR